MSNKPVNRESLLEIIGKIVKDKRKALGLTVMKLSQEADVSVGVISDLENNRGRVPSLVNYIKLAEALDLPKDMFTLQDTKISTQQEAEAILREALRNFGLNKTNIDVMIVQITALRDSKCNVRQQFFN